MAMLGVADMCTANRIAKPTATLKRVHPRSQTWGETVSPSQTALLDWPLCALYVLFQGRSGSENQMTVGSGLGMSWGLGTALSHIEQIEAYEWHQQFYRELFDNETLELGADTSVPSAVTSSPRVASTAFDGLLLALRDGYIRATGRRSTIRKAVSGDSAEIWRLHASDPTLITTDEWRSGEFDTERCVLTGSSWQYVQIEFPDFMVKAIWPEWPACDAAIPQMEPPVAAYTTPYLELMQEAIAHFGLTADNQSKKKNPSDWFFD